MGKHTKKILFIALCLVCLLMCMSSCDRKILTRKHDFERQIYPLTWERYEKLQKHEIFIRSLDFIYLNSEMDFVSEKMKPVNHKLLLGTTDSFPMIPLKFTDYYYARYHSDNLNQVSAKPDTYIVYDLPFDIVEMILEYLEHHRTFFFNNDQFDPIEALKNSGISIERQFCRTSFPYPGNYVDGDKKYGVALVVEVYGDLNKYQWWVMAESADDPGSEFAGLIELIEEKIIPVLEEHHESNQWK